MTPDGSEPPGAMASGPLADLLMTAGGIFLILAVILLAQAAGQPPQAAGEQAARDRGLLLVAERDGVRLGADGTLTALDGVPEDRDLSARLAAARTDPVPPLLLIAHDGIEAAFLVDNAAAAAGLARLRTLRLTRDCAGVGAGWLELCRRLAEGGAR